MKDFYKLLEDVLDFSRLPFYYNDLPLGDELKSSKTPKGTHLPTAIKTKDYIAFFFKLPGVKKENIDVSVNIEDKYISVKGTTSCFEKYTKDETASSTFGLEEENFSYVFSLDLSKFDVDNVETNYSNGILEMVLPRKKKVETEKEIKITVS